MLIPNSQQWIHHPDRINKETDLNNTVDKMILTDT